LRSVANQMLVESLKHAAYAVGNLAFGNFSAAGTHAAASAAFGAGALTAGAIAREMGAGGVRIGAGGGGYSGRSVSAGSGARSSGGGQAGPVNTVIAIGTGFGELSYLEQRQLLGRAINRGKQGGSPHGFDN